MKSARRKKTIFSAVIVCLLLLFVPLIFSSISDARSNNKKEDSYENQVKIYGEDTITITANHSFHPKHYYKAVDDNYQLIKLNYSKINTSKPGRHSLTLSAKNKQDYDKRKVLIIVEEEKVAPSEKKEDKTHTAAASQKEATIAPVETPDPPEVAEPTTSSSKTEQTPVEPPVQQEQLNNEQEIQPVVPEETQTEVTAPQTPSLQPNQISFHGQFLPYVNAGQGSGQGVINGSAVAATWGGNPTQSGMDNQNTHFIGHNPGIFSPLLALGGGDAITVTDNAGNATTYIVNGLIQVDDSGRDIASGIDNWDQITSAGGGERITLQTCLSDTVNLIVYAQA